MLSITHTVTSAFLPRDIRHYGNPYLPYPKQKPYLETPHARHS